MIANGITGSTITINDALGFGTVVYDTDENTTVFDMYIVTDKYIYQAELSYDAQLASKFDMFTKYMENSFTVNSEVAG